MPTVTIYHNPNCSKSRDTLSLLKNHAITPHIELYLDNPPSVNTLQTLVKQLGFLSARELMRCNDPLYQELQLGDNALTEDQLLATMHQHPKLIERPIVTVNGQARIGRPPEKVFDIIQ